MSLRPLVLAAAIAFAGCAKDVHAVFPGDRTCGGGCLPTGSVAIELSRAAPDLTVAVDGVIVSRRNRAKRVVVTNVPARTVQVDVAFGGGNLARAEHHVSIDVVPGAESAVVLPGPEQSMSNAVYVGLYTLGSWVFLGMVYHALL